MTQESGVGVIGIEYQLPYYKVDGEDIANHIGWETSKVKVGLGMHEIGAPGYSEDVVSMAMSAVSRLMQKYDVKTTDVCKIEVGSESHFDAAKSIKTYLLSLFPDNLSISGCDNINACYGGTNALLNCISWMESSLCKAKYAIVVCTDISVYDDKPAMPTSGAGAVAMLVGRNPVYRIVPETFSSYSSNEGDFLKHKSLYFPYIDGKQSVLVYNKAFDTLYSGYKSKFGDDSFKYICLHSPFPKLVAKTCKSAMISTEKYEAAALCSRHNGNTYTASLYFSFISLLHSENIRVGDKVAMFSFGSGCVSSIFCLQKMREGMNVEDLQERLDKRVCIDIEKYMDIVQKMSTYTLCCDKKENVDGYVIAKEDCYFRTYKLNK